MEDGIWRFVQDTLILDVLPVHSNSNLILT